MCLSGSGKYYLDLNTKKNRKYTLKINDTNVEMRRNINILKQTRFHIFKHIITIQNTVAASINILVIVLVYITV